MIRSVCVCWRALAVGVCCFVLPCATGGGVWVLGCARARLATCLSIPPNTPAISRHLPHTHPLAGKYRQQGKEYTVDDGDVIFFKFNCTTAGKK